MAETVAVIGAGTMGEGIAQIALQAGHAVVLIDTDAARTQQARQSLANRFAKLAEKGKISAAQAEDCLAALQLSTEIGAAADAGLVIEAVVEKMAVKQALFAEVEACVGEDALLASNTSSLSLTEMAAALHRPGRFIGLHFFNPPPLMPLVEVIRATQSETAAIEKAQALMQAWGKQAVLCQDTPGFIVNRVARPFYIEGFRLLEERALTPAALDAAIRGAGFRMGVCELTDLIGQDVNYAVSQSLWTALGYPPHLKPSFIQGQLVAARFLGRKSGGGFYRGDAPALPRGQQDIALREEDGRGGGVLDNGVLLRPSDGRRAADHERDSDQAVMLFDYHQPGAEYVALACGPKARQLMGDRLPAAEHHWLPMPDRPGLVNLRLISQIINEAATCALQGIAGTADIDRALKGGVNYPRGAFEFLDELGLARVINTLSALQAYYGGAYAVSPYLTDLAEAV